MINLKFVRNLSIKNKLIAVILLVTYSTISVGFAFIAIWDMKRLKSEILSNLVLNAKLTGTNCIAPLTFGDNEQASTTLSQLKLIDFIENAYLYDASENIFAIYPDTTDKSGFRKKPSAFNNQNDKKHFYINEPIYHKNVFHGTILIKADTKPLDDVKRIFIINILILTSILLTLAFLLARKMQKIISVPIINLKNHIINIGNSQDYSTAIIKQNNDEIGDLYDGFNMMYRKVIERESALLESELRYSDLYENSPDMFVSVDAETAKIIQCNTTLAVRTGYTKDEIIGQAIFTVYHSSCIEDAKQVFEQFKTTGEVNNAELQLKKKDGGFIDVLLNAIAIRNEDGKIIASRSVWRDISDRKNAENELENYKNQLEEIVKQRTNELEVKNKELENMNDVFVGREFRIRELKDQIKRLKSKDEG